MFPPALDCWYLTGPTASGKTRIGLALAERLGAEILSLDSMAVYRGMDIGTAKPAAGEQARVRHHLIDVADPNEEYSLAEYVEAAHAAIADVRRRGRDVLFVGGTPLYLKSLLRGVSTGPPADHAFRRAVIDEVRRLGTAALHERLAQVDPLAAAKLHPNDLRRIVRALEVYKHTGRPLSHAQTHFDERRPAEACKVFWLDWPREELHRRIDARVERMFRGGLVEEVGRLADRHGELSRTARQAVGYGEVLEHLAGKRDLAATIELVRTRTRQFAKRQRTWFRSLSECRRLPMSEPAEAEEIAERIVQAGGAAAGGEPL
jgi:tRNA dimethylallyltransferase